MLNFYTKISIHLHEFLGFLNTTNLISTMLDSKNAFDCSYEHNVVHTFGHKLIFGGIVPSLIN